MTTNDLEDLIQHDDWRSEFPAVVDQLSDQLIEHSHDAVLLVDVPANSIVAVNPAACELLGYTEIDLLQTDISTVHAQEMDALRLFDREVQLCGHGWSNELSCTTKDGRQLFAEMSAFAVSKDERKLMLCLIRDVTEKVRAGVALRQSERRYRLLADNAPDCIFVIHPESGQILDVNQGACDAIGLNRDVLLGMTLDQIRGEPRPGLLEMVRAGLEQGHRVQVEDIYQRGDRQSFPVEVRFGMTELGGASVIQATARDVSLRKRTELEETTMVEIGRLLSSTLDIEQVFDQFATQVRGLLPFDRISIAEFDADADRMTPLYVSGMSIPGLEPGADLQFSDTRAAIAVHDRRTVIIDDAGQKNSDMLPSGIGSALITPLISNNNVIGVLALGSVRSGEYGRPDERIAERVATQVSAAVVNARLYERAQRESQERAAISAISLAVNSDLDLSSVYNRVADQISAVIHYDRLSVRLTFPETPLSQVVFVRGDEIDGAGLGSVVDPRPYFDGRATQQRDQIAFRQAPKEIPARVIRAGLLSGMVVPLEKHEESIGFLSLWSREPTAYSDRDELFLKQVAAGITPAIQNARLFEKSRNMGVIEERNRIAREIHDSMAHDLAALVMQLNVAEQALDGEPGPAASAVKLARNMAARTVEEARRSVLDLSPGPLMRSSLTDSLKSEVEGIVNSRQLSARFESDGIEIDMGLVARTAILRVCQEALTNVVRHAHARTVIVKLAFGDADVKLSVSDDGIGIGEADTFEWTGPNSGFGLENMRERARLAGGDLTIRNLAPTGTEVVLHIPGTGTQL